MAQDSSTIKTLRLHATLKSPTPLTRTWSSQPHPDPRTPLLATASSDKSVHIWDMRDWRLISTINGGHKRSVRCVGWKDYGSQHTSKRLKQEIGAAGDDDEEADGAAATKRDPVILATGSFDANVGLWVWNRDYGKQASADKLTSIPGGFGEDEQDFTNSRTAGDGEEEDEEWHFSTLLTGPDSEIKDLQFSPAHYGANLLATCSRDKSVWVWEEVEPEEWETIAVLGEHTGDVKCVRWLGGVRTSRKQLRDRLQRRRQKRLRQQQQQPEDVEMGNNHDVAAAVDDTDGEEVILAHRELLATSSYDDTIRLHHDDEAEGDWLCIAVMTGHDGTVWDLKFEPFLNLSCYPTDTTVEEIMVDWMPRLLSCSDDMTIRLWRKELNAHEKEKKSSAIVAARQGQIQSTGPQQSTRQTGFAGSRLPSSIRVGTSTESWIEDARLPSVHVRSIYAIDWSEKTGLVVSCGGDGIIAVYREVPTTTSPTAQDDVPMNRTSEGEEIVEIPKTATEWKVVAMMEGAHDEYEINHVCWATKRDGRLAGEVDARAEVDAQGEGVGEYIISTGDDGDVRVWELPDGILDD